MGGSKAGKARRARRRGRLSKSLLVVAAAAVLAGVVVYLSAGQQLRDLVTPGSKDEARAAIVDQLSLTDPNPTFAEAASSMLAEAGYAVEYYTGEEVTVEFYETLPRRDHDLLILRVHSGVVREVRGSTGQKQLTDAVALATGEPYDEAKYGGRTGAGRLGVGVYQGSPSYFGITPAFVRSTMEGSFDGTTVILMGCDGLISDETAETFLEKGAGAFVSWSGPVSAEHTDAATERLLRHLLIDGLTTGEAVAQTAEEVGPDPEYGSTLLIRTSEG